MYKFSWIKVISMFLAWAILLSLLPLQSGTGSNQPPTSDSGSSSSNKPSEPSLPSSQPPVGSSATKYHKVEVSQNEQKLNEEFAKSGGILLSTKYETALWRISDEQYLKVKDLTNKRNAIKVRLRDDLDLLGWSDLGKRFNTQRDPEPILPANLRQVKTQAPQMWLIQYIGDSPRGDGWGFFWEANNLEQVEGGRRSQVIWVDGARISELEAMANPKGPIQWTGPFHPAYRISDLFKPYLDNLSEELITITVNFYAKAGLANAQERLKVIGGGKFLQNSLTLTRLSLRTTIPANRLVTIANWADVYYIEPYYESELDDEVQNQIVAGNIQETSPGVVKPTGPNYLQWLRDKGFPTTPSSYPIVALTDTGLDSTTPTNTNTLHPAFHQGGVLSNPSRVLSVTGCVADRSTNDVSGHGTSVAGIAGGHSNSVDRFFEDSTGDAIGYDHVLGVSPYGNIVAVKIFTNTAMGDITDRSKCGTGTDADVIEAASNMLATVNNNSWSGLSPQGRYTDQSQAYDKYTRDASPNTPGNQPMLHVFTAGNAGNAGNQTVRAPGTGKNVLTVGATENVRGHTIKDGCGFTESDNANNMAEFSSAGPTADGRAKPEVSAPGMHIASAASQDPAFNGSGVCGARIDNEVGPLLAPRNKYYPQTSPQQTKFTWSSGTSFSSPAVAGAVALATNYYNRELAIGQIPSPAMQKSLIVNSARYLFNPGVTGGTLPDPVQGWGQINLDTLTSYTRNNTFVVDQQKILTDASLADKTYTKFGKIAASDKPFRVTLAWTDPEGAENCSLSTVPCLRNDLNLRVTVNGKVYLGNRFSGQYSVPNDAVNGAAPDIRNNLENVYLPIGLTGEFKVEVIAANLQANGVPDAVGIPNKNQDFALVIANANTSTIRDSGAIVVVNEVDTKVVSNDRVELTVRLKNLGDINNPNDLPADAFSADDLQVEMDGSNNRVTLIEDESNYRTTDNSIGVNNEVVNDVIPYIFKFNPPLGVCGTVITFVLTVRYNDTSSVLKFSVATPSGFTSFPSPQTNQPITGNSSFPLTVAGMEGKVAKVKVGINVQYTPIGNLGGRLKGPDGIALVILFNGVGGSDATNFTNTVFDDAALTSIDAGSGSFTGSYRPQEALFEMIDQNINGTWTLELTDSQGGSNGTLINWALGIRRSGDSCLPDPKLEPYIILATAGTPQTSGVDTQFANKFEVAVRDDLGQPVSNASIIFTAPQNSTSTPDALPSGKFQNGTTTYTTQTDANGVAQSEFFRANIRAGKYFIKASIVGVPNFAGFVLANTASSPRTNIVVSGTPQGTVVNTNFPSPLVVKVVDVHGNPTPNRNVTFIAGTGTNNASGRFGGSSAVNILTNLQGLASVNTLFANGNVGDFIVTAQGAGTSLPANFMLTNQVLCPQPAALNIVVTQAIDNGLRTDCGTLSRALLDAGSDTIITFNLAGGANTIQLAVDALPLLPLKSGITINGGSCISGPRITIDGLNVNADGLVLEGNNVLRNLKVTRFGGKQILNTGNNNVLTCVVAKN